MNSQLLNALLLVLGLIILGCQRTDRPIESSTTASKATEPPNIPTNAISPKPITK